MTDDRKTLGKASLVLLTLAALGMGALIGTRLADRQDAEILSTGGAPIFRYFGVEDVTREEDNSGQVLPTANGENFIGRETAVKSETLTIELAANGAIEYKALMRQGDAVVFRWSTDDGQAYYDFHAHDEAFGPGFYSRYDEGEGNSRAGSIIAAYDGQHGWYWQNLENAPLTITLEIAGFYDEVIKVGF
jgi:hypothetical protein